MYDAGSIKIFKSELYKKMKVHSKSLFFEAEFIIHAKKEGAHVLQIPVSFVRSGVNYQTGGKLKNIIHATKDLLIFFLISIGLFNNRSDYLTKEKC
jgi:hypothetical protein